VIEQMICIQYSRYVLIKTIQTLTDSFTGFTLDIFLKYNFGVEAKYDFWQIRIDLCSVHQGTKN
jgi:hypothetical protein